MKLYLRLNITREKEIVKRYSPSIYGVVLEAHIYDLFKSSWSKFLSEIDNMYIVDPVTYKFGLPEVTPDFVNKKWFEDLIKYYNIRVSEKDPYINPQKMNKNQLRTITKNVLEYQIKYVPNNISKVINESLGLLKYISQGIEIKRKTMLPEYIIPPYLIIEDADNISYKDYLKFNITAVNYMRNITKNKHKILSIIPIGGQTFLDNERLKNILIEYTKAPTDVYGIWIIGLDETQKIYMLEQLGKFALLLKEITGKPVINMFAGYFSLLLHALKLLDGLVHGIGYGEYRDPYTPTGPPPPRYYNNVSHKFDTLETIIQLYSIMPEIKCKCSICNHKSLLEISRMKVEELMIHFIENRLNEIEMLKKTTSCKEVLSLLDKDIKTINEINSRIRKKLKGITNQKGIYSLLTRKVAYNHLEAWKMIIDNICRKYLLYFQNVK